MTWTTAGGGWMLFGDLTSYNSHWGGSYRVGSVDRGDLRDLDNGYSLQLSELHEESDEYFDIMIQYGQDNTYDIVREGYQKNGTSFWYGENLGINKVNGYYLSHCSDAYCNRWWSRCIELFDHQICCQMLACGWYSYRYSNYWTTCPEGDDEVRQRYFVRYVYDADDDGFVAVKIVMI